MQNLAPRDVLHYHEITSPHEIPTSRFIAAALSRPYMRTAEWGSDARRLPRIDGELMRHRAGAHRVVLVQRAGLVALVELDGGSARVRVAGSDVAEVEMFVADVQALLPSAPPNPEAPTIPVTFWSLSPHGARSRRRKIAVPSWADCRANYPARTFSALHGLMGDFAPGTDGQLLLWQGDPGTGKTFALRALAWEWREWCDLHYITDPEVLFGESASYMLDVLLEEDTEPEMLASSCGSGPDAHESAEPQPDPRAADGRWRLLVLEDTGEMMSADARERAGQGLGRLLNVVDGLIGQGLRILVLVTTNEHLGKLHPAVARPGRCASSILFERLSYDEAVAWLAARGHDQPTEWEDDPPRLITAANLYAIAAGAATSSDRELAPIGFGR